MAGKIATKDLKDLLRRNGVPKAVLMGLQKKGVNGKDFMKLGDTGLIEVGAVDDHLRKRLQRIQGKMKGDLNGFLGDIPPHLKKAADALEGFYKANKVTEKLGKAQGIIDNFSDSPGLLVTEFQKKYPSKSKDIDFLRVMVKEHDALAATHSTVGKKLDSLYKKSNSPDVGKGVHMVRCYSDAPKDLYALIEPHYPLKEIKFLADWAGVTQEDPKAKEKEKKAKEEAEKKAAKEEAEKKEEAARKKEELARKKRDNEKKKKEEEKRRLKEEEEERERKEEEAARKRQEEEEEKLREEEEKRLREEEEKDRRRREEEEEKNRKRREEEEAEKKEKHLREEEQRLRREEEEKAERKKRDEAAAEAERLRRAEIEKIAAFEEERRKEEDRRWREERDAEQRRILEMQSKREALRDEERQRRAKEALERAQWEQPLVEARTRVTEMERILAEHEHREDDQMQFIRELHMEQDSLNTRLQRKKKKGVNKGTQYCKEESGSPSRGMQKVLGLQQMTMRNLERHVREEEEEVEWLQEELRRMGEEVDRNEKMAEEGRVRLEAVQRAREDELLGTPSLSQCTTCTDRAHRKKTKKKKPRSHHQHPQIIYLTTPPPFTPSPTPFPTPFPVTPTPSCTCSSRGSGRRHHVDPFPPSPPPLVVL